MTLKQTIGFIAVFCVLALGLGYLYVLAEQGSGKLNGGGKGEVAVEEPEFLKQGLVAYYPFNGNANDESGNGNDGTVNGATLAADRNGESGKAYDFDGIDGYIHTGKNEGVGNAFSLAVWFKSSNLPSEQQFIFSWAGPDGDSNEIRLTVSDEQVSSQSQYLCTTVIDLSGSGGSQYKQYYGESKLNSSQWYHAVMTWDGVDLSIMLDGQIEIIEQKAVDGAISVLDIPRDRVIGAGRTLNQGWFNGQIDDVRIYNRALSGAEVKALYELEKAK